MFTVSGPIRNDTRLVSSEASFSGQAEGASFSELFGIIEQFFLELSRTFPVIEHTKKASDSARYVYGHPLAQHYSVLRCAQGFREGDFSHFGTFRKLIFLEGQRVREDARG